MLQKYINRLLCCFLILLSPMYLLAQTKAEKNAIKQELKALKKLNETKYIAYLPLLDIAYAILAPAMYYSIDKKDKNKW